MKGITAIMPALNEEVAIGSMVILTRKYVERVIVVDDGSTDRTSEVARLAGAEVIIHEVNRGKGAALKTGFEAAAGSEIIVTIDSDGQHDPADIPLLVEPIIRGEADMVNGSRYINGAGDKTPIYRRLGQVVLDRATSLCEDVETTDSQSGLRAFSAKTVSAFRFGQSGLAIESEMLIDAAKAGLRVAEVGTRVRYDVSKPSEHPVSHGIHVLVNVLHDMELRRPLYYFTIPGMIFAAVGIAMGLGFLRDFSRGGSLYFGPTLLMILLTLIGTFMSFTGIMLHTMSRLINESRKG